MENSSLFTIFVTGLFVGGISCLAVQGGLFTATIAQREEEHLKNKITKINLLPVISFLLAKLFVYTIVGAILGLVGSVFAFTLTTQVVLQIAVAIFMLGTALNILNIHPFFRHFVILPPKAIMPYLYKKTQTKDIFAPALLGALTVFVPCGTTQAIMALAIASGSPGTGSMILFLYVLGTIPLFFFLGFFATKLSIKFRYAFLKLAAVVLIFLALFNLNNSIALTGSRLTLDKIAINTWCVFSYCDSLDLTSPVTEATILLEQNGFSPNVFSVKKGAQVTLHLINNNSTGCTQAFTIPTLGIQKIVTTGNTAKITFTAPSKTGEISFVCGTGFYRGRINVI